jgi:hypothetical protein
VNGRPEGRDGAGGGEIEEDAEALSVQDGIEVVSWWQDEGVYRLEEVTVISRAAPSEARAE